MQRTARRQERHLFSRSENKLISNRGLEVLRGGIRGDSRGGRMQGGRNRAPAARLLVAPNSVWTGRPNAGNGQRVSAGTGPSNDHECEDLFHWIQRRTWAACVRCLGCSGYVGQSKGLGREWRPARMAAPSAPVYWGRGETRTAQDKAVSRARTMPDCSATPPVKQTGGVTVRPASAVTRSAMAFCTPAAKSAGAKAFGQQPDDLGFGKDHAHAADERRLAAVTAQVSQGCQIDPQPGGDDFEEAATAGGTAVVHGKVPHATAVFEGDEFAVLATDLDDAADFWRQVVNTLRVASDLGNCGVRKPHGIATVASGNDGADGGPVHFRVQ